MANRHFNQFSYSLEKKVVFLYAILDGTGASAPNLMAPNGAGTLASTALGYKGIKSITRTGVGDYTINLQDSYFRLLDLSFSALSKDGATTPLVWDCWIKSAVTQAASGGGSVRILTYGSAAGTPVEANTNDRMYICLTLSDSNAP